MCPHVAGTSSNRRPVRAAAGFLTSPAASLLFLRPALRLALGLSLGLTLRLALGFFLGLTLRLALGFFLGFTLRLALGFLLDFTLRLALSRLSTSNLPFLRLLARNFLPRTFLGSHISLHVGLTAVEYIQASPEFQ